ncbi:MAG TPA: hypothetical protein VEQ40_00505 [Pyrinomonadaceae bacterium]|nr:hypothetical protein [Pyrinomonadaceae bacterium]
MSSYGLPFVRRTGTLMEIVMRIIKPGLMIIVFLLLSADAGYACTCVPPPSVAESLSQAGAVFSGKVLQVKRVKGSEQDGLWQVEVVFAVNTSWKGARQRVISVFTASQSAACGYSFMRGRTYLVYAGESQGKLATTICSRTKRLKDARLDLKELGAGKLVRKS